MTFNYVFIYIPMRGLVYKIVHSQSDLVYVGMTTNTLAKRWQQHKNAYNKDSLSTCSIYQHMRQHGVEQFKIMLIKEYDVVDKRHLRVYETLWINKLSCVNKLSGFNPIPKRAYRKQYYESNKETIKQRSKDYNEANKEAITQWMTSKVECNCEAIVSKRNKARHRLSQKHQLWLTSQ